MTEDNLIKLRDWVQAEIKAGIADSQPGSDGHYGTGYSENKEADRLFNILKDSIGEQH